MEKVWITFLLFSVSFNSMSQTVIGPKGTKIAIDSSKWKINGNNVYNKNSGGIGIGTANPTAQFHTTGDVRFQGIGSNTLNTKILTADANGNITTRLLSNLIDGSAVTSINGIASSAQTFVSGASGTDFNISSLGSVHTFNLPTASATNRGALSSADWSTFNGKENALTFSQEFTRATNTISIKTNSLTNSMLAQIPTQTFKGRSTAGNGNVEDLTAAQATAMLTPFTSSAQGVVPASGGGTTNFLRADGTFAIPPGSGRTIITLASDVVNNNNQANTLQDVGLSFNMIAGNTYRFNVLIPYTSEQVNNGSRWIINCGASAPTFLSYVSRYSNGDASESINWCNFTSAPGNCNQNSTLTANLAVITGVIKASVNATFKIQFASATKNTAITAKAGASLEYW
jgi:hypothetical protein